MTFSGGPDESEQGLAPGPYAGFGERLGAWLLDIILIGIVGGIAGQVTGVPLLATAVEIAYFVYFTGSSGQTLGKRVLKIKVVRADGAPMEYGTAAMREVLGKLVSVIVLGIGFLFPLWDQRKQALHDKIASTLVVKAEG